MTDISEIPTASQLQLQLDTLYKSIDMLGTEGTTIPNMTVMPAPSNDPMQPFTMAISLNLDPAITNRETLAKLSAALQLRATDISLQLQGMGYQDDTPRPPVAPPGA
jgi:hypothetical protein